MDLEEIYQNFKTKKVSANRLIVYTSNNRIETLKEFEKQISNTIYMDNPSSISSVGYLKKDDNFLIIVKPTQRFVRGKLNEKILFHYIEYYTKLSPINVIFHSGIKKLKIENVQYANLIYSTTNRKKADLSLTTEKDDVFSFSVKKDDSEYWESADSYFAEDAKKLIQNALVLIYDNGSHYFITPNIATIANNDEKKDMIFGSDIDKSGAVLIKTFTDSDFVKDGNTLFIKVNNIIQDINDTDDVYFLIRNDKTRNGIEGYPGLRVVAVSKSRITNNCIVLPRGELKI